MTMITPSYLGETIEYSSLHACRSTLEDPTPLAGPGARLDPLPVWSAGLSPCFIIGRFCSKGVIHGLNEPGGDPLFGISFLRDGPIRSSPPQSALSVSNIAFQRVFCHILTLTSKA